KITTSGIDAGGKKITGVQAGTGDTDAVNFGQLNKAKQEVQEQVEKQVAANSFVKQDSGTRHITIGKETDGDKIDITNNKNGKRTLTGIKDAVLSVDSTEAVNGSQIYKLTRGLAINTTDKQFTDAVADAERAMAIGSGASVAKDAKNSIAIGNGAKIDEGMHSAIAIGHTATAATSALAIGDSASAKGKNAFALGYQAKADTVGMISIGSHAGTDTGGTVDTSYSVIIGLQANASVRDSIALGGSSIADVEAGIAGYDPRTRKNSDKQDPAWHSAWGALSIGNSKQGKTRQIINVAAGTKDTDAVNVAQLKALQDSTNPNWELSVDGKNKTNVNSTNPMDLAAESANLTLTKGEKDNKVKFDLAKDIVIDKVQTGNNILDATGLVIGNGPKITTSGIDAGGK
ncbi:hypothetical protein ME7_01200, partial [Bartonella birtlesii LL-WM9]